ncbi:unnamed protein product [Discula destructiva]
MPGSFQLEGPGASTTLNANMFRPPLSPSNSSYNLAKSTGSLLSDTSMATGANAPAPRLGRKRTHDESNNARGFPFPRSSFGGPRDSPIEDNLRGEHPRYALAGQIETPGAQITPGSGAAMDDSLYSDVDYRRALGPKRSVEEGEAGQVRLVNEETGEPITPREAGWTTFAFQAIGGVVGKVWEFCRGGTGAFRGFQAGGGKAFEFNGQPIPTLAPGPGPGPSTAAYSAVSQADTQEPPSSPPDAYPVHEENTYAQSSLAEAHEPTVTQNYFLQKMSEEPMATPNPFQQREPSPDTTPEWPAAKRRQTGHFNEADELRTNWVMVQEDERSPTPANMTFSAKKASAASSRIPAASRSNMTSRLQQSPRFSTPNAGRRMNAPSPRFSDRSNIPTRASSRMSMASPASFAGANSPSLNSREPASYASPRSPSRTSTPNPFTPTGSRIPAPKGFGPNPFANTRTISPSQPRLSVTASRPSTGGSLNPAPLTQNFNSRLATPTSGHRKSKSTPNVSGGTVRGGRTSLGHEEVEKMQKSPRLDDEGRHLATKRFATEKRNYSRLDKLNMELQGLIRQGQEALGTSYDVDMDESWEEDA